MQLASISHKSPLRDNVKVREDSQPFENKGALQFGFILSHFKGSSSGIPLSSTFWKFKNNGEGLMMQDAFLHGRIKHKWSKEMLDKKK